MGDRKKLLDELNEIIKKKETEESEAKAASKRAKRPKSTGTRAEASRVNGATSQGPTTPEGKQRASANSLKHGFFANVEKLNPQDAPVYQRTVHELRHTLHPVEEMQIRELAMLSARLQRLEAAEYALLCSEIEAHVPQPSTPGKAAPTSGDQIDSRSLAAAFLNTQDNSPTSTKSKSTSAEPTTAPGTASASCKKNAAN